MAITFTPTVVAKDEEMTFSASSTVGQVFEWTIKTVPTASAITVPYVLDDIDPVFTPDVVGDYVVNVDEFIVFEADGETAETLRKRVATQTLTFTVASVARMKFATVDGHGATLKLKFIDAACAKAELEDELTERSVQAAIGIQTELDNMVGFEPSSIGAPIGALRDFYNAHITFSGGGNPHDVDDTTNVVINDCSSSSENAHAISVLRELGTAYHGHINAPLASPQWHNVQDETNQTIAQLPTDTQSAWFYLADLIDVYNEHVIQSPAAATWHNADDTTNDYVITNTLLLMYQAFLRYIKTNDFESYDNSGGALAANYLGATEDLN